MNAREHFEAAARALAAAEAPDVAPCLRDEHLESMHNHLALARLADRLDWNDMQKARETAPTVPGAIDTIVPAARPTPGNPWAWVVSNREPLRELGKVLFAFLLLGAGIVLGLTLHDLADKPPLIAPIAH